VITINLTKVEGGIQLNVVPAEFIACEFLFVFYMPNNFTFIDFDVRLPPTIDYDVCVCLICLFIQNVFRRSLQWPKVGVTTQVKM
jgi:hypothetical protein